MLKVTGLNEIAQMVEYDNIIKTHEKKAKKAIINERVNELVAEGIDKEIAKVMASVGYEYGVAL